MKTAIVFPLVVALFLWIANQGWCRVAASKDFATLCKAEVRATIHGDSSVFKSTSNFRREPYLTSKIEQTFIGLKAEGHYELENGMGERDFTCLCACGVFQPKVSIAIH